MTEPDFITRRATPEDAARIAELGARTFLDAFGAANDPAALAQYVAEAFSLPRITAELRQPGSIFLLGYAPAFDAARPAGYARLLADSREECVRGARPIELVRLYVDGPARGRGYGAGLLRSCLDVARAGGFETLWLGVWEENHGARRFYRRWGFEEVGAHAFLLGDERQTDLIMERRVGASDHAPE